MTMTLNKNSRPDLPNKAYDSEYATQFRKEYMYLKDRGIEPSFVKPVGEYRIRTYKYTKTPELFRAVADFYEMHRNEKQFAEMENMVKNAAVVGKMIDDLNAISPDILKGGVAVD